MGGLQDVSKPFKATVGEAHIAGRYLMTRYNEGWRMIVIHFGEILDKEDPLFNQVYEFSTPLFLATD